MGLVLAGMSDYQYCVTDEPTESGHLALLSLIVNSPPNLSKVNKRWVKLAMLNPHAVTIVMYIIALLFYR